MLVLKILKHIISPLSRRLLLVLPIVIFIFQSASSHNFRDTKVPLWEDTSFNNKSVTLEIFLPENIKDATPAIIICPGGSYCWLDYETEGVNVAKWLSANGCAAFVLKYRVQGIFEFITHSRLIFPGHQHPQMIQDGQRAIQYIRENAAKYNINPNKLGVIGFSAGGHLAMSLGEFHSTNFVKEYINSPSVSLRPDFVAPIYPVVTFSDKVVHKRSRRALLGEYDKYKKGMRDSLSLELHVPNDCPPVFLINCKDDPIVNYHNSELLDSALTSKGVKHVYIQYKSGGHGFGASENKGTPECRQWKKAFLDWLNTIGIL